MENKKYTIGIRRENKSNWERRSALVPNDIKQILNKNFNIKFIVQPSKLRIFTDYEYKTIGAEINQDLSNCDLIIGVKEVGLEYLIPNKTYIFFSHTIKAQIDNMPLLDAILQKNIRLMDFQNIKNQKNERLISFGKFAGIAGAIDFLCALGWILLKRGYSTQFLYITYSYTYISIKNAYDVIKNVSIQIEKKKLFDDHLPFVFVLTGSGRTANGVLQVITKLPHKIVKVEQLPNLKHDPQIIYICQVNCQDIMINKDGKFNKKHYKSHPQQYTCLFQQKVLPYASCLFHCIYWQPKFPKYITREGMKKLVQKQKAQKGSYKFLGICDVTCDKNGSIQFLDRFTTPDDHFYLYDTMECKQSPQLTYNDNCIVYQSFDFLPCQLSNDASQYFSNILKHYLVDIMNSKFNEQEAQKMGLPYHLQRAVMTSQGKLTKRYEYINQLGKKNQSQ